MSKKAIICGGDAVLAEVRAKVLENASFNATTVLGLQALKSAAAQVQPGLVVLCSSLEYDERLLANQWIAEHLPGTALITCLRSTDREGEFVGETIQMTAGPSGMVGAAHRLTGSVSSA
jgi:hypothetical protein